MPSLGPPAMALQRPTRVFGLGPALAARLLARASTQHQRGQPACLLYCRAMDVGTSQYCTASTPDKAAKKPRTWFANIGESESKKIMKASSANKRGLALRLDQTLKSGHDMRVFGLGTAASMVSRERYGRFTSSMHAAYQAMEDALDRSSSPAVMSVWCEFGDDLRRKASLEADLEEVGVTPLVSGAVHPSRATNNYVQAIYAAAEDDNATGGARLLGHVYVRYFADLFGGQALAGPTRWALQLAPNSPRHYDFGPFGANRRESIEKIYAALNETAEKRLSAEQVDAVVDEAKRAFAHNAAVYAEDGRLYTDAARGLANVALGYVRQRRQPV